MLSSEVTRWGRALGFGALALGAMALGGCQVQPLYGAAGGQNQSVTISAASSRVSQVVRNELVLGFGGERADGAYVLDISASSSIGGILPGGLDNEFSAARATVTATYVLKSASDGETIASGSRAADAQLDLPSQNFAQERAKLEAENRAARTVAAMVRADVAAALSR